MKAVSPLAARPTTRGFTLVEIMTVVVIIGLLAALAIPTFQRISRRSKNSAVVNNFRVFAQAFEQYAAEYGQWPPIASPGQLPAPLSNGNAVRINAWQAPTPIGGQWTWESNDPDFIAGVTITNFTCDDIQLAEIDAMLDDGVTTTGAVRKISNTRFTFVLDK